MVSLHQINPKIPFKIIDLLLNVKVLSRNGWVKINLKQYYIEPQVLELE